MEPGQSAAIAVLICLNEGGIPVQGPPPINKLSEKVRKIGFCTEFLID